MFFKKPGVGENAPIPKEITLVSVVTVIDGPASESTSSRRCSSCTRPAVQNQACISRKPSSTPKTGSVLPYSQPLRKLSIHWPIIKTAKALFCIFTLKSYLFVPIVPTILLKNPFKATFNLFKTIIDSKMIKIK